jgi:hypothetical protein
MDTLVANALTIEAAEPAPPEPLTLTWRGKADDRYPDKVLRPFFAQVLARALERGGGGVAMHFEHLDHFNSSTISTLIRCIQDARQKKVKLVLCYNQALKWQKLSFDALRVFAKDDLLELRAVVPA